MPLRSLLGLKARRAERGAMDRVRDWARAALGAAPDTAIVVNEIVCHDPGCPGVETVILVMEPGRKTRAIKVPQALDDVTEAGIREACALTP